MNSKQRRRIKMNITVFTCDLCGSEETVPTNENDYEELPDGWQEHSTEYDKHICPVCIEKIIIKNETN
jgi:predicted RNA-binding Zn-ribbon protein involved in translation (DUF1610 family)